MRDIIRSSEQQRFYSTYNVAIVFEQFEVTFGRNYADKSQDLVVSMHKTAVSPPNAPFPKQKRGRPPIGNLPLSINHHLLSVS